MNTTLGELFKAIMFWVTDNEKVREKLLPFADKMDAQRDELIELRAENEQLRGLFAELQDGCGSTVCKVKRPAVGNNGPCRCAERLKAAELGGKDGN